MSSLAVAPGPCRVRLGGRPEEHADVFEAALVAMEGSASGVRCENGWKGAIEAAALVSPGRPELSANRILDQLRQIKVRGFSVARIVADIRQLVGESTGGELLGVKSIFPDAPVPENLLIPPNWEVSAAGISRRTEKGQRGLGPAILRPMFIGGRQSDVGCGTESLQLVWSDGSGWRERSVPRVQAFDRSRVVELAGYGAPVTSNNASEAVQYLADCEQTNLEILPRSRVSGQMGWQHEMSGFLWGQADLADESGGGPALTFRAADSGEAQASLAFRSAGTFEDWKEALRGLDPFPRVRLGVCAALAAPLLGVLGASNFAVDFCGPTSVGKTTTLRVAASVWGRPGDQEPTLVAGWNSSRTWVERAAAASSGLPMFLDDSRQVTDKQEAGTLVYDVTNGRGRGRGSVNGFQRTLSWQTVLISTGEAPLTSFSRQAGTRAGS